MNYSKCTHCIILLFSVLFLSHQAFSQSRMFIKERVVINPCPPCPKPLPIPPGEIGSIAVLDKNDVNYYGEDLAFCYKIDTATNRAIVSLKFLIEYWPNSYNGYALKIKAKDINGQVVSIASVFDTALTGNPALAVAGTGGWYEVIHWDAVDREYKGNIELHINNPTTLPGSGYLEVEFELGYYPNPSQTTYTSYLTERVMKGHPCQDEGVGNVLRQGIVDTSSLFKKSKLVPNPVSDYLEVILESDIQKSLQIKIMDMKGNLVISTKRHVEFRTSNSSVILKNLTSLKPGVYSIILESDGNMQVKKFVKL